MHAPRIRPGLPGLVISLLFSVAGPGTEAATPVAAPAATPARPSIVLISIDTLRSDHLPIYGYDGVETPAIDALAEDGIVFERAYTPVPLTMPAHASILTGMLPPEHGVRDNIGYRFASAGAPYLPRLLREEGYSTGGAVSVYILRGVGGFADGFDFFDDEVPFRPRVGLGSLQRPGDATLDAVLPWLRSVKDEPFFLFLHLFEPHAPYEPPEPFRSRYASPYDGEIATADAIVGRLLAELRRLGAYDDSVVVLLSDHGEGLGDHGEEEHGLLLYRESLQVPLVIKLPHGRRAATRRPSPVGLPDVAPTLLELAGVEPAAGRSLLADEVRRAIYSETWFPRLHFGWSDLASLIEGRYHYVWGPDPELYDLAADPGETRNLVAQDRRTAARMRAALRAWERDLATPEEVEPAAREALAALGYVGHAAPADGPADGTLADPKSRLRTVGDIQEGLRRYGSGDFAGAVEAYLRAVEANPRSLDAWEYLGRSLHELGRLDEARTAYQRAVETGRAPHLATTSALILLGQGRTAEALAYLRQELRRTPGDTPLRLLEARALLAAGKTEDALAAAGALVRDRPDNADAVYLRGAVRIGQGKLVAAEEDLRRALELAPGHTAAMSDLAVVLRHRGAIDEARELWRRVLELRPEDENARRELDSLPP